ncbi:MAG TPA: plastocyanin/azurin family copper-binding protein [Nitrososphaeraceae archaeon]|nr:plastocyanin/azurin family copper-binding protein [Nitrososphaeraceae archaeon]
MVDLFRARYVTTVAMIFFIVAPSSISAPAFFFTQTAIASTEGQIGTTTAVGVTTASAASSNATTQSVAVGGGNITLSINQFSPRTVEVQRGESVTFFAPPGSIEVHNVIFDLSIGTVISDVGVPFTLPSDILGGEVPTDVSQQLVPASPYNLGEPLIQNMADGTQAIVGFNKIAFYPAVVDQNDNVVYLEEEVLGRQMLQIKQAFQQGTSMPSSLSVNYTMNSTERVVSSGIILDVNGFAALEETFPEEGRGTTSQEELGAEDNQGIMASPTTAMTPPSQSSGEETITQQQEFGTEDEQIISAGESEQFPLPQFPFIDSFTVTFNEPGTYDYFCAFHPGMFGQVVVVGSNSGA